MSRVENSINPRVQTANGRAQFCETLVLLSVTLLLCGLLVLDDATYLIWWALLCITASVLFFYAAFRFSHAALEVYESTRYVITHQTIRTLEAIEAPRDLRACLEDLGAREFNCERDFLKKLNRSLGSARCEELKGTIFKYTKTSSGFRSQNRHNSQN